MALRSMARQRHPSLLNPRAHMRAHARSDGGIWWMAFGVQNGQSRMDPFGKPRTFTPLVALIENPIRWCEGMW